MMGFSMMSVLYGKGGRADGKKMAPVMRRLNSINRRGQEAERRCLSFREARVVVAVVAVVAVWEAQQGGWGGGRGEERSFTWANESSLMKRSAMECDDSTAWLG